MRVYIASLVLALGLVGCDQPPPSTPIINIEGAAQADTLLAVDPAIYQVADLSDSTPSRYAIGLRCADWDRTPECAARAAVRASAWLRAHDTIANELLVNIDGPGTEGSYQLRGTIPASAVLHQMTVDQALAHFQWNGGGDGGKDAASRWCLAEARETTFCQGLASDACNPLSPPDTAKLCRALGR
jgi:hypothetical protein